MYATKASSEVSWFQAAPTTSLRLLGRWASPAGSVLDVGSGASTLVDALLRQRGEHDVVLDISQEALSEVRDRLGEQPPARCRSLRPMYASGSPTAASTHGTIEPSSTFSSSPRTATVMLPRLPKRSAPPGGVVVLGTFAADGPTQCSGLPTARYDPDGLARVFGPAFVLARADARCTPRLRA